MLRIIRHLGASIIFMLAISLPAFGQIDTSGLNPNPKPLNDTIVQVQPTPKTEGTVVKTSMFKGHSPKLATLMSAVLPGLGQAYNRSYWKIPIIYGGFTACAYFFKLNNTYYKDFKRSYTYDKKIDNQFKFDPYPNYSKEQLRVYISDARRYRDLNAFLIVLVYALNVVDACVDAHLYKFDVSDDLSLKFEPHMDYIPTVNRNPVSGISLTLSFK